MFTVDSETAALIAAKIVAHDQPALDTAKTILELLLEQGWIPPQAELVEVLGELELSYDEDKRFRDKERVKSATRRLVNLFQTYRVDAECAQANARLNAKQSHGKG